jgi:hypothetical protein
MSIIDSAILEMKRANFENGDIETMRQILRLFFDQWDSGGAVWVMVPVLEKCLSGAPLSPLTGEDDEWMAGHREEGMSQNIRCGTVFKFSGFNDGVPYDIDDRSWNGTFPYMPGRRNLDPCIEMNGDAT